MFLTKLCLLGGLALSIAVAQSLTIVNPDFSAVAVQCSTGWAYQSVPGGTCESSSPEQDFNIEAGIGWTFIPQNSKGNAGITGPNTAFMPPPFTGLPFGQAALLQNQTVIFQKIDGFVPGQVYKLTFYLGSRYAGGCCEGNQTVLATLDNVPIGVWKLVSSSPFTLRTAVFRVATGRSHILAFTGTAQPDNTAFFSAVSIEAAR